jgi:purine-binding chemotaxis protein CheW
MNLAELRKKAQKERQVSVSAPITVLEDIELFDDVDAGAGDATELQAESDSEYSFHEEEPKGAPLTIRTGQAVSPAMPWDAPESEVVPVRSEPLPLFDPIAVLLAGRDAECADLSDAAAPASIVDAGDGFQEFLCFRVSSEIYAINIMVIKEIIKPREVTEVPRAPAFVSGVLSLRGIIIPVFNMRLRLGLPSLEKSARERIVVLRKGEDFFGFIVDEVIQVVRIAAAAMEKPPAVLDGIDRDFVSGIGRYNGQMLIVLNQDKILDLTLV